MIQGGKALWLITMKVCASDINGSTPKANSRFFPFGYGLSYTKFKYTGLHVDPTAKTVTFTIENAGALSGTEIAEVYVGLPKASGEHFRRLAAWQRSEVNAGQQKVVTVPLEPLAIATFDEKRTRGLGFRQIHGICWRIISRFTAAGGSQALLDQEPYPVRQVHHHGPVVRELRLGMEDSKRVGTSAVHDAAGRVGPSSGLDRSTRDDVQNSKSPRLSRPVS